MNKIIFIFQVVTVLSFTCLSYSSYSQTPVKKCSQWEMQEEYLKNNPHLVPQIKEADEKLESHTQEYLQQINKNAKSKNGVVYIIPTVFHILHNYGTENISDAQVKDALRIINEDFRKINADNANVVNAFKTISADAEIEFRLARKDPNGNCTTGINHIYSPLTTSADDNSKINQWTRNNYLNVWVVKTIGSGAAGYTYLPAYVSANPGNDGIILIHNYTGSIGTSSFYNHSLSHEIGHWINLLHCWGAGNTPGDLNNCSIDDLVNDTPNTIGWETCNINGATCGSAIDNVQNFMEYSYCDNMFTEGQKTRMRAALNSSVSARNQLWAAANLTATGVDVTDQLCAADFTSNQTTVCAGQQVQFTNKSYNAVTTNWNWIFNGATPSVSTQENPTVIYNQPGKYDVTLTAGNTSGSVSTTQNSFITVLPNTGLPLPYFEGFENDPVTNNQWFVFNPDNSSISKWAITGQAAYSGSKSIRMYNFNNGNGQREELMSTTLDMSANTSLDIKFRVAFALRASNGTDKLTLYVSGNCGQTWAIRWVKSGSLLATAPVQPSTAFVPVASQWVEYSVPVTSSLLTKTTRLRFVFESNGGNNLYLDDINIFGLTGNKEIISNLFELSVVPNPSSGDFRLGFTMPETGNASVSIVDVIGRTIYSKTAMTFGKGYNEIPVNVGGLNPGVFFVRWSSEEKTAVRKIIIQP